MNEPYQRKKLPRHPLVWWSRMKARWPFLVWAAAIVAVLHLYSRGVVFEAFSGVVETREQTIAPVDTARLESYCVTMGQQVTNGQPIARMDASLIDAEIALNEALAVEASQSTTENLLQLYNRFQSQVTGLQGELNAVRLAQASAVAESTGISAELARLQPLIEKKMIDSTASSRLLERQAALKGSISCYPESIQSLEQRLATANSDTESLKQWLEVGNADDVPQSIIRAVKDRKGSPQEQVAMLKVQKERYTLRAVTNGIVSRILQVPGNVVVGGTPVALVILRTARVNGLLPEVFSKDLEQGMEVWVRTRTATSQVRVRGTIEMLSVGIDPFPNRFRYGNQVVRGRRIVLALDSDEGLLPGETVDILIESRQNPSGRKWRELMETVRGWFKRHTAASNRKSS